MIEFSADWPECLNDDSTVLRHELGHALVWLAGGGVIERIRFTRAHDRLLCGGMRIVMPAGWDENRLWTESPIPLAERVLAGEIAAREYNGLPQGIVCSDLQLTPASDLGLLLRGKENEPADGIKALFLAHSAASAHWHPWLSERHATALALVQQNFEAIDNAADVFYAELPLWEGEEVVIDGGRVARQLGFSSNGG